MKVGFTGTRKGMTPEQTRAVTDILRRVKAHEIHHGGCRGADEQVHLIAKAMGLEIVVRPMKDAGVNAGMYHGASMIYAPKKPLERNRDIIRAVELMVATPRSYTRPASLRGEGTWTTISYAIDEFRRETHIVYPDGTVDVGP